MTVGKRPSFIQRRAFAASPVPALLLALLLASPPAAADPASPPEPLPNTIVLPQADGSTLELERPAATIVTLSPHLTELVYAAGAGDRLVATVAYSDFPPEALELPRVGDAFRIDLERVLTLAPDLVLAWESGNPGPAVARLRSLDIPTWITEIRSPPEIAGMLELIGRAAGTEPAARAAADETRQRIGELRRAHAARPEVSYFYQVDPRPLYTIGGEHLIARSLALCGGRNVFADAGLLAPQVTHEAVIAADPDAFLAPSTGSGANPLDAWREWPGLDAVQSGALYLLPADEISRATPRMLDAVAMACSLLHGTRARQVRAGESHS